MTTNGKKQPAPRSGRLPLCWLTWSCEPDATSTGSAYVNMDNTATDGQQAGQPLGLGLSEGLGARGWIAWDGGRCPLPAGAKCDTQHRDGSVTKGREVYARDRWHHLGTACDIVAYRVTDG